MAVPGPRHKNDFMDTDDSRGSGFDPFALGHIMTNVMDRARPLIEDYLNRHQKGELNPREMDPLNIQEAYAEFITALMADPERLMKLQMDYWNQCMTLWTNTLRRYKGETVQDLYKPESGDRRFKSDEWQENLLFDYIKQSYLMTSRWMQQAVRDTKGLDKAAQEKLDFYTRQFADAMAPTNFVMTNPEVLRETVRTNGENLVRGLENLLEDMERGQGKLKISTTDYGAFELGKNIAITPGRVVFQNPLFQLIQYAPATDKVFKRPLLIIPPWINKYYILDMKPDNSFVKWLTEQGHTVFMMSWVNPDASLSKADFSDYMKDGVIAALDQIQKTTGEKDANVIGYCIGGTLLSMTLSWMAQNGHKDRIASATFLTTLIDFADPGELKLFTDKDQLALIDAEIREKGYLTAENLKQTFSVLRANDLIWSFVINNYLMGKEPFPFDLLYWNDDSTNMPGKLHSDYLHKMYGENRLCKPGGMTVAGTDIDIGAIDTPAYFLSTREDHIAPWKATYEGAKLFKGPVTFTLAASGHIAGVVNPAGKDKYGYWTGADLTAKPDQWLGKTTEYKGSWWPHWQRWILTHTGPGVYARQPADGLDAAPGTYVKKKAE